MNPTLKMWKNRITGLIPRRRVSEPSGRNGFFRRVGWLLQDVFEDAFAYPALTFIKTLFFGSIGALAWLLWFAMIPVSPQGVGEYIAALPEQKRECVTSIIWKYHQNRSVAAGDLWHAKRNCGGDGSYAEELAKVLNK